MTKEADSALKKKYKVTRECVHIKDKRWFNSEIKRAIEIRKMHTKEKINEKNK